MAEYIDREKMLKYLEENNTADEWIIGQYNADWIYSFIESQPTADVVEVVRCKKCKYSSEPKQVSRLELYSNNYDVCFCEKEQKIVCGTHFCSHGERSDT